MDSATGDWFDKQDWKNCYWRGMSVNWITGFTCEFLLASVTANLPERRKKEEVHINYFVCGVYCFRFGKESGMTSILLGRNLQLKLLTKEYLETSVKNTQN